jgi:hypothetical protein
MNSITITLPVPHKYLNPNNAGRSLAFARGKSRVKKAAKGNAYVAALAASKSARPMWKRATIHATLYCRTHSGLRMDADNLIASLKPHADGIADAGIVENDIGLVWLPPDRILDKANPRLVLTITESA